MEKNKTGAKYFQDDGGTPEWRARHAKVIDVRPPGRVKKYPWQWTFKESMQVLFALIVLGTVGLPLLLIGLLSLLALWDWLVASLH